MVPKLKNLSIGLWDPKTIKRIKISKSLFGGFLIGINQIDHEESENCGPETLGSILRALGLKDPEKNKNFKVIIWGFPNI